MAEPVSTLLSNYSDSLRTSLSPSLSSSSSSSSTSDGAGNSPIKDDLQLQQPVKQQQQQQRLQQQQKNTSVSASSKIVSQVSSFNNTIKASVKQTLYASDMNTRRNSIETYTKPIMPCNENEANDIKEFFMIFYKTIYTRKDEIHSLLNQYPDSVGRYYEQLVVKEKLVSYEDFWQRYFYKCNEERIAKYGSSLSSNANSNKNSPTSNDNNNPNTNNNTIFNFKVPVPVSYSPPTITTNANSSTATIKSPSNVSKPPITISSSSPISRISPLEIKKKANILKDSVSTSIRNVFSQPEDLQQEQRQQVSPTTKLSGMLLKQSSSISNNSDTSFTSPRRSLKETVSTSFRNFQQQQQQYQSPQQQKHPQRSPSSANSLRALKDRFSTSMRELSARIDQDKRDFVAKFEIEQR